MDVSIQEFGRLVPDANYVLRPGGYVVITNSQGQIAVVSTPQGFFLPGGGQECGESPAEAAVRETLEECGLRVYIKGELGAADELVFSAQEGKHLRKRCVFFIAELIGREERRETDHDLVWMSSEDAISQLHHQSQTWAVMQASD
ncbi:MAG TPA: NUDIX domain-containing protein [Pyrinomonadaceae bacterium]